MLFLFEDHITFALNGNAVPGGVWLDTNEDIRICLRLHSINPYKLHTSTWRIAGDSIALTLPCVDTKWSQMN